MQKKFNLSSIIQTKVYSNYNYQFLLLLSSFIILTSCGVKYTPNETFEDQEKNRHIKTETFLKSKYPDRNYKSLAFGKTIVYKPSSFNILDSLYAVKQEYINNDELRELKMSGIEEMIDNYRSIAQRDIGQVKYEFEHIYYINKNDSIQVNHDYFVYDHKDSLVIHTPFYNYTIPTKWKELHNSYLFEFHFTTDRDIYISGREREFLGHFKAKEEALIGEPELQSFMNHTLNIMSYANRINSIDFNLLTKQIGLNIIKHLSKDAIIESFGTLIALEGENEIVLGYERTIKWTENEEINETTITFSQYLEFEEMETITKDK
jgi:hypothetical protein